MLTFVESIVAHGLQPGGGANHSSGRRSAASGEEKHCARTGLTDLTEAAAALEDPDASIEELLGRATAIMDKAGGPKLKAAPSGSRNASLAREKVAEEFKTILHGADRLIAHADGFIQQPAAEAGVTSVVALIEAFMDRAGRGAKDEPMSCCTGGGGVLEKFRAAGYVAPPATVIAPPSAEADASPEQGADGSYPCEKCELSFTTPVQWYLHRAAVHGARLPPSAFPAAATSTDEFRQDYRGAVFRLSREGFYYELTAAAAKKLETVIPADGRIALLQKGDSLMLKDGTKLLYDEAAGSSASTRNVRMRVARDEQDRVREDRERWERVSRCFQRDLRQITLRGHGDRAPSLSQPAPVARITA
ncbi:pol [Symbiodinium sp. CCMP2592]|nr:pol [Symbiodinium sp. CCMP2592]